MNPLVLFTHDEAAAKRLGLSPAMLEALWAMREEADGAAFAHEQTCKALERRGLGARTGRTRGVRHLCALTRQGRSLRGVCHATGLTPTRARLALEGDGAARFDPAAKRWRAGKAGK